LFISVENSTIVIRQQILLHFRYTTLNGTKTRAKPNVSPTAAADWMESSTSGV